MVNFVSPGVYTIEKDDSQYAPTIDSSVVGIVGFASKGPVNDATLITSPQGLVDTFGEPNEGIAGQGLIGAVEILEATNNIYFVRAADSTVAANASATIGLGACPAVIVSANGFGVTTNLYLYAQVYDNLGVAQYTTPKLFSIPSGTINSNEAGASQGAALQKVIGGSLDSAPIGAFFDSNTATSGFIVGSWAGSGAYIEVSAASGNVWPTSGAAVLSYQGPDGNSSGVLASSVKVWGVSYDTNANNSPKYLIQSLYPGAGYNAGTKSNGDASGNTIVVEDLGYKNFNILVTEKGVTKETFKASFTSGSNFIHDIINTGSTDNLLSEVIQGQLYASGSALSPTKLTSFVDKLTSLGLLAGANGTGKVANTGVTNARTDWNQRFLKLLEATYNLAGGNNGIPSSDTDKATALIGDSTASGKTGMQALNDDTLNISLACVPGITNQNVQNALVTLAEQTQNFLAVVSPPLAIGNTNNAIDWHNGQSASRTAALNSSYAGIFWPWVKTFSVFDGIDRWLDPVIYAVRQLCYTDSVAEPWFAGAGYRRGRLTKPTEVEVKLNQGDLDSLYSGGNVINAIMNFVQQGITIFGNRSAQRNPTSLDRINVRRLMIYLRKVLLAATRDFVFEPNDEFTWKEIEEVCNPLLDDIKRRRGITEFRVVCDETVNTPIRVDRNELWVKILLKPTKTAEMIIFELNLTNQSAKLGQ